MCMRSVITSVGDGLVSMLRNGLCTRVGAEKGTPSSPSSPDVGLCDRISLFFMTVICYDFSEKRESFL